MLPPRCRLPASSNTTQRLRQRHPTPNTQRPILGPCAQTPNAQVCRHPTPNIEHPTPKIEHPTPKNFSSASRYLLIWGGVGSCWDPAGVLGGGRRLGAPLPSLLGAAAARLGSAARWGAAARRRRGVPARAARKGRPESDPTPFLGRDPGATLPHTQRPNTQRPIIGPSFHPTLANNSASRPLSTDISTAC